MNPLYIDVSDEVTTVIERLKDAPEKEIALVVPKGAVLLQSIVNLKLVRKAAKEAGKELTVITTDRIGRNLAAQAGIANLAHLDAPTSSEIITEPAVDMVGGIKVHRYYYDENDKANMETEPSTAAIEPIIPLAPSAEVLVQDDESAPITVRNFSTPITTSSIEIIRPRSALAPIIIESSTIPTIPKRRSALPFLTFLLLLLLLAGTAVAVSYFPKTTIAVSVPGTSWTKTYAVQAKVGQSVDSSHLASASYLTANQNDSLTFQATGTKDVGTLAHGTATLSYIQDSTPQLVPAGTVFSANGIAFTTDQAVTVPGAKVVNATPTAGTANVAITASQSGTDGNLTSTPATVAGFKMYGQVGQTSGGTTQLVPVITQTDIANAKQQLQDKLQAELAITLAKNPANHPPVTDSAKTDTFILSGFGVTPSAGTQIATGTVTASGTTKRLVYDPAQLDSTIKQLATKDTAGLVSVTTNVQVSNVDLTNGVIALSITASGVIIPTINTELIRTQTTGKSIDNATSLIQGIVSGATVTVSQNPHWWPIKRIPFSDKYVSVHAQQ